MKKVGKIKQECKNMEKLMSQSVVQLKIIM